MVACTINYYTPDGEGPSGLFLFLRADVSMANHYVNQRQTLESPCVLHKAPSLSISMWAFSIFFPGSASNFS